MPTVSAAATEVLREEVAIVTVHLERVRAAGRTLDSLLRDNAGALPERDLADSVQVLKRDVARLENAVDRVAEQLHRRHAAAERVARWDRS
jgi:hypothetical protein